MPDRSPLLSGLSGGTRVAAVIGDPIRHSLSPALHNAAYRELGIDWVYVAFKVAPGRGADAVGAMRTLGLAGLSVTMPHKADVARAVDRLTPMAATLGVANTVRWSGVADGAGAGSHGDVLVGDSTDGAGFLDALRLDGGFDPAGQACVVLGAGGAARSVTLALAGAGPSLVSVVARRAAQAESCAALAGPLGRAVQAADDDAVSRAVRSADLVVNATPVGMAARDDLPLGLESGLFAGSQYLADLIYAPAVTPFIAMAKEKRARHSNGLGMLIHQAARQVELWTGRPAPIEAMSAAAVAELSQRPS